MSTEAELRRIWGADYDKRLDDAVDAFDSMSADMQQKINQGSPAHLRALADMRSPAYLDRKHPEHEATSQRVSALYSEIYGSDPAVF